MRQRTALTGASLLVGVLMAGIAGRAGAWLAEYGIEGMHVVSSKADEMRASISPDGKRIVGGSRGRERDAGGRDLWQASLLDGRWQDPRPLALNAASDEFDPMFSADGQWLYFVSDRDGGEGGDDLYRVAVHADGFGEPVNLGPGVNTAGNERTPTPAPDGRRLMFASDGHGGAGGLDLFVARLDRASSTGYADATPLALSFNTAGGTTFGPAIDWNKPGELLVTGVAKAPRAGGLDIYRMKAPAADGKDGCVD